MRRKSDAGDLVVGDCTVPWKLGGCRSTYKAPLIIDILFTEYCEFGLSPDDKLIKSTPIKYDMKFEYCQAVVCQ